MTPLRAKCAIVVIEARRWVRSFGVATSTGAPVRIWTIVCWTLSTNRSTPVLSSFWLDIAQDTFSTAHITPWLRIRGVRLQGGRSLRPGSQAVPPALVVVVESLGIDRLGAPQWRPGGEITRSHVNALVAHLFRVRGVDVDELPVGWTRIAGPTLGHRVLLRPAGWLPRLIGIKTYLCVERDMGLGTSPIWGEVPEYGARFWARTAWLLKQELRALAASKETHGRRVLAALCAPAHADRNPSWLRRERRGLHTDLISPMLQSPYRYASLLRDCTPFVHASDDSIIFELRTAHIALLQEAAWEWDEDCSPGAPSVGARAPFGHPGAKRIPVDIFHVIDDADPETLIRARISERYAEASHAEREWADTQALNGIWAECGLAMSVLLHCARCGLAPAHGSKWKVSRVRDAWAKVE